MSRRAEFRALGVVLSIGKLAAGQQNYYLNAVANGVEDYYTGSGEAPGRWVGSGVADLDLRGTVRDEDLHAVLSGLHPRTGELLGRRSRRVPGFDATFSAPKSASLLFALGSAEVSRHVRDAHDAAVAAALGYLERQAAVVRRGTDGVDRMATSGFVAAAFRHRTSRAGDPQLHMHVLIANAARGIDGRWGALDARLLYLHKMAAGFLYQAHLRHELTQRLGVAWRPVRKGLAEIDGMPAKVLRGFSRRRIEIEARMGELGVSGQRAAEIATLDTRHAKDYGVDVDSLRQDWRRRADALGLGQLTRLLGQPQKAARPPSADALGQALTEHASSFDRRHVLEALAAAAQAGATVPDLERTTDRYLTRNDVVALRPGPAGTRYSTEELMGVEARVIDAAVRHRRDGVGVVEQQIVDRVLRARPGLADEQAAMVRGLTRSGAAVDAVVGVAGSGKTVALDAARAAWEFSGHRVIGASLAARAAAELEAASGIDSFTLASLLQELDRPGAALPRRSVVVVDEAAMVGTRQLDRLLRHARAARAKVVLVGDDHQLPEIEAGGAFRGIRERLGAFELRRNRRQREPNERRALAALRVGAVDRAIASLEAGGRITCGDDLDSVMTAMVSAWHEATTAGRDTVMLTLGRAEAEALNRRARRLLHEEGRLCQQRLVVGGVEFAVGDEVIGARNWRRIGILNGTRGRVVRVNEKQLSLMIRTTDGDKVVVPAEYIAADHLRHAYATTIHKAQGRTCDVSLLLGDERLYREAGYSALTRGRDENRLYFVRELPGDECRRGHDDPQDLARILRRSKAQHMAADLREGASIA